jgi:FtsX-like permease family protein
VRGVVMVLGGRFRQHWRSWLALSVLVAVVGGFVLAAAAAARQTAAAFPDFVARHGYDVVVYSGHPLPQLARLPSVASVTPVLAPVTAAPRCSSCRKPIDASNFVIWEVPPRSLPRMVKLVSGRLPDQSSASEVLASYTLARDNGVHIGTLIRVPLLSQAQGGSNPAGQSPPPQGPLPALRVVGIVAAQTEFPSGSQDSSSRYDLYATAAFAAAVNHRAPLLSVYYMRLRHGAAGLAGFDSRLRALDALGSDDLDIDAAEVEGSIGPQAVGWWVLAGLAALAGLAVIGQAIARQAAAERADYPALSALGMRRREFVLLELFRALCIGAVGAAGGVTAAALLSPLTPVGEARLASVTAGEVALDPLILPLGALATVAAVAALSAWPAVRHARLAGSGQPPRTAPVPLVRAVAAVGAPASALIGIRHALQRSHGAEPVPVGTALLGMVMAVAALCATAVFGASLAHLVSSPALYGVPYQAYFAAQDPGSGAVVTGPLLDSLRRDRAIERITLAALVEVSINGKHVRALAVTAIRGPVLISAVDGQLPRADRQIVLGAATMRTIGARQGALVRVTVTDPAGVPHSERFRVIGRASFPPDAGIGGLGNGAAMTVGAFIDAQCPPGRARPACQRAAGHGIVYVVTVRSAPGPAGDAALARHIREYHGFAYPPGKPTALVNFGESVDFPLLFGLALSLFGAATMVHLLLVSVARRRNETGLLKVLGFVRHQIAAVICWQATTVALIGIVVGVPLGTAMGRVVWQVFAMNFGVVPVSVAQPLVLAALAAGVLAAANVLAAIPALLAARPHPGKLLRAE